MHELCVAFEPTAIGFSGGGVGLRTYLQTRGARFDFWFGHVSKYGVLHVRTLFCHAFAPEMSSGKVIQRIFEQHLNLVGLVSFVHHTMELHIVIVLNIFHYRCLLTFETMLLPPKPLLKSLKSFLECPVIVCEHTDNDTESKAMTPKTQSNNGEV